MRIFISLIDETGSKRTTRLNIAHCLNTTVLISQICREICAKKNYIIIKLKYEPYNLRIAEDWPISHYPIKSGSTFLVEFTEKYKYQELSESTSSLQKIQQEMDECLSEHSSAVKISFISNKSERDDQYFQQCLKRLLEAIRKGDLDKVALILKEEPEIEDEKQLNKILERKYPFLLNEVGDCGRNALHWAIHIKSIDIVSFLLIKGTNPTTLTIDEYTALQLAVQHHSPEIMKVLLEQKLTDINQVTSWGTALHLAVLNEDAECIQILFQNDADIEACNRQGKKAIEICKNKEIKQMLLKKAKTAKMEIPTISKGSVFKVSSHVYRHKQKIMILNPFKQELSIENEERQIQDLYLLASIQNVEIVEDKSWLMNDNYYYFKIYLKDQNSSQIIIALRNQKTFKKWIKNFTHVFQYLQNSMFNKPVLSKEQTIELINDEKNQIKLHKRKVPQPTKSPKVTSIMNLPISNDVSQPSYFISVISPQKSDSSNGNSANSRDDFYFKESEIVLGSVIKSKQNSANQSPRSQFQFPQVIQEGFVEQALSKSHLAVNGGSEKSKFRKNSQKIEIVSEFKADDRVVISFRDFQVLKLIGNGSFGQVYLAKYIKNSKIYALKVLTKKKLIAKKQLKYAVGEANILKKMDSPFIITLHYAFQTPLNLYMALDNCSNGDLSQVIVVKERLSESTSRFVIAQVILAIEYLHSKSILYRDMKPENILIANDGYIKLTDFGLSKENCFSMSFCGSPAYLSPEMLQKKGVGFESDIYGIGTVLFEMVVGQPPFFDENMDLLFENIKTGKLKYPSYLSIEVKSLISKLLQKDVAKRIGAKDFNDIKKHDFFKTFNWDQLTRKKLIAPNELFINEQDSHLFEPVALEKKETITIDDTDYRENSSNMMSRVKNFTFARNPSSTKYNSPLKENARSNQY